MSASKNKAVIILGVCVLLLVALCLYNNHRYDVLSHQSTVTDSIDFHNQFAQGKACGLLTTKEAATLLGTPVGTSGTIIPADNPTSDVRPGSPRVDSCSHTALKSSDGYIDIVIKDYGNKVNAAKYYDAALAKYFPTESREAGSLGQKLRFGSGDFYLLRENLFIEVSASKTPRAGESETEAFSRSILETVVAKL